MVVIFKIHIAKYYLCDRQIYYHYLFYFDFFYCYTMIYSNTYNIFSVGVTNSFWMKDVVRIE